MSTGFVYISTVRDIDRMEMTMTRLRERAVQAAWEEVRLHSLRFTMADVTRRLHMSKSSLYKIVSSKAELVHLMLDHIMCRFNGEEQRIRSSGQPIAEQIHCLIQAYLSLVEPMTLTDFYRELEMQYPREYERWQTFFHQKIDVTIDMLQQGVDAGVFRPISLQVLQRCLYASAAAITVPAFLKEHDLTYQEALESLEDILFHGLLAKPE